MTEVAPGVVSHTRSEIDFTNPATVNIGIGGAVLTLDTPGGFDNKPKGFLLDLYGLFTVGRVCSALCGIPFCYKPNIQWGYGIDSTDPNGLKSKLAYEVRQKTTGCACCQFGHFRLYKHGEGIAEPIFLGKTGIPSKCCGCLRTQETFTIDKPEDLDMLGTRDRIYLLKNYELHPRELVYGYPCCPDGYITICGCRRFAGKTCIPNDRCRHNCWAPCRHCDALKEGNVFVNTRTPIYRSLGLDGMGGSSAVEEIGILSKSSAIEPWFCCCASPGATLNMRVDLKPEFANQCSEDDKALFALLIASNKAPIPRPDGGPAANSGLQLLTLPFCLGDKGLAALGYVMLEEHANTWQDYTGIMPALTQGGLDTGDLIPKAQAAAKPHLEAAKKAAIEAGNAAMEAGKAAVEMGAQAASSAIEAGKAAVGADTAPGAMGEVPGQVNAKSE